MRRIGFSTGALARGDFQSALRTLRDHDIRVVELSALRVGELDPLVAALPLLDLRDFSFVSVHAPSRYDPNEEPIILRRLQEVVSFGFPVVVHPDVIVNRPRWKVLGASLFIENMDKRKPLGRTVCELEEFFIALPAARFCFDIGHARQVDPSMTEAALLVREFRDRIAEVHISEVNTASRHDPISINAVHAFSVVLAGIDETIPIVLESLIDKGQSDIKSELQRANDIFAPVVAA